MPYTVTPQGDDPILLVEMSDPFDFRKDPRAIRAKILDVFGSSGRPFFIIYDLRKLPITFNDVVTAVTDAVNVKESKYEIFQDYGRMSLVGAGPLITLTVRISSRFVPTSGEIRAFDTVEEALEYARSQVVGSG